MRKISIQKLQDSGLLSHTYVRYRDIVACYKRELRKGKPKLQAIYDAGEKKGASQATVYNAIKAISKL